MNTTILVEGGPATEGRLEWRVAGMSMAGTSHVKTGLVCQDNRGWFAAGDLIAVAVSDGAGSAPSSHVGSAVAVRAAITNLLELYETGQLKNGGRRVQRWFDRCPLIRRKKQDGDTKLKTQLLRSLGVATKAVEEAAASIGAMPRDLATTLIVVVAGPEFVAAAQIGDGAVVVGDRDSNLTSLTAPSASEFLNETTFLTSPSAPQRVQVNVRRMTPANLAVFSDGLQMLALKMPMAEPHAPFFTPLFRYISATPEERAEQGIEEFLRSKRIGGRTDDDVTLVLAHLGER